MLIPTRWQRPLARPAGAAGEEMVRAAISATFCLRKSRARAVTGDLRDLTRIRLDLAGMVRWLEDHEDAECRLFLQALRVHLSGLLSLCSALEAVDVAGPAFHHFLDVPRLRTSCERQAGAALHYALQWCQKLGVNPDVEVPE